MSHTMGRGEEKKKSRGSSKPGLSLVLCTFCIILLFNFILHGHVHTMCVDLISWVLPLGLFSLKRSLVSAGGTWQILIHGQYERCLIPCMRHNVHLSIKYEIKNKILKILQIIRDFRGLTPKNRVNGAKWNQPVKEMPENGLSKT